MLPSMGRSPLNLETSLPAGAPARSRTWVAIKDTAEHLLADPQSFCQPTEENGDAAALIAKRLSGRADNAEMGPREMEDLMDVARVA